MIIRADLLPTAACPAVPGQQAVSRAVISKNSSVHSLGLQVELCVGMLAISVLCASPWMARDRLSRLLLGVVVDGGVGRRSLCSGGWRDIVVR